MNRFIYCFAFLICFPCVYAQVPTDMSDEDRRYESLMLAGRAMAELNNYYRTKDISERPMMKKKILYLFDLASKFDSLQPNIYHYRSFAYRAFAKADSALMDLNRYEEIVLANPKLRLAFDVNSYRAFLLANLGRINEAMAELKISLQKRPIDSVDTYYRMAWLHLLKGDTSLAYQHFAKSIKSDAYYYREKYMGPSRFVNITAPDSPDSVALFYFDGNQTKFFQKIAPKKEPEFLTMPSHRFKAMAVESASEFELAHPFFFKIKAQKIKLDNSLGPGRLLYATSKGWVLAVSFQKDTFGKAPTVWPITKHEAMFSKKHNFFPKKIGNLKIVERFVPLFDVGFFRLTLFYDRKTITDLEPIWNRFSLAVAEQALEY